MRLLAAVLAIAACHRDEPQRQPEVAPRPKPIDAAVTVDAPPPPPSIHDEIARIIAGNSPTRTCFALSANRRRAACDLGSWSFEAGIDLEIGIVGDLGDAKASWPYLHGEGLRRHDSDPRDRPALEEARTALEQRRYTPNTAPEVELGDGDVRTAGSWILRRTRTFLEHEGCPVWDPKDLDAEPCGGGWDTHKELLEVQCKQGWKQVPLDADSNLEVRYGTPRLVVSPLTDRTLLVVVEAAWGIEGDHGGSREAAIIDIAPLCGAW